MKKRLVTVILAGAMVLSMTACGGKETAEPSSTSTTGQQVAEQTQEDEVSSSEETKINAESKDEIGAMHSFRSYTEDGEGVRVYMNFPIDYSSGRESLYAHMTYDTQDTETIALIDSQTAIDYMTIAPEYEITSFTLDNMMNSHSSYIVDSIDYNYGAIYADFAMEVSEGELIDVNGTEMCKHIGTLTYTKEGTFVEKTAVAYVAPVSNGTYVIVVVCSLDAEKAEADATFMAQTIRENVEFE